MGTTASVDLSDYNLWRDGFPDELFAELRRNAPVFHHELTERVERMLARDFWVTTKHAHAQRIHRDIDSFTAADGPLIQAMGTFSSYPTLINMDPPELNKRRRVIRERVHPAARSASSRTASVPVRPHWSTSWSRSATETGSTTSPTRCPCR